MDSSSVLRQGILLVEDSRVIGSLLQQQLANSLDMDVIWVQSLAEAQEAIATNRQFFVAILDYCLPDAPEGEIVDFMGTTGIPLIVFTSDLTSEIQEFLWSKCLVDYVIKDGQRSISTVIDLIDRLRRNRFTKVLVVDDSKAARRHLRSLLERHQYSVLEASNGNEALSIIETYPELKLVITDFEMPEMDGFELTKQIRLRYGMDRIGIIGLSASGNHRTSVRFMKQGANDFLNKPFISEHLYCRIVQTITLVENFDIIRKMSCTDYLTKLGNRRYFFETAERIRKQQFIASSECALAMIDIDHFKKVNDMYGHEAGDGVLQQLALVLEESYPSPHVVSRFGGEEFCVLTTGMGEQAAMQSFEALRKRIAQTLFKVNGTTLPITVSIGVSFRKDIDIPDMIGEADERLYVAKENGRNRIVGPCVQPVSQ